MEDAPKPTRILSNTVRGVKCILRDGVKLPRSDEERHMEDSRAVLCYIPADVWMLILSGRTGCVEVPFDAIW